MSQPRSAVPAPARPAASLAVPACAAVGLALVYLVFVGTGAGQRLDALAMDRISAGSGADGWAQWVLGQVSATRLLALSLGLGLVTAVLRGRAVAVIGVATTGLVVVLAELLKLGLDRPQLLAGASDNSFPSGHVAVVAGLAAALVVAVPGGTARRVVLAGLTPLVGLAGLATVVLQWHRPSDVAGSVLLALAVGGLAARLADRRGDPRGDRRGRDGQWPTGGDPTRRHPEVATSRQPAASTSPWPIRSGAGAKN
jgi:membrane-associated phospholipid phosphatase